MLGLDAADEIFEEFSIRGARLGAYTNGREQGMHRRMGHKRMGAYINGIDANENPGHFSPREPWPNF